jgi:hypothetical protein
MTDEHALDRLEAFANTPDAWSGRYPTDAECDARARELGLA